jgi:hypothetical protein
MHVGVVPWRGDDERDELLNAGGHLDLQVEAGYWSVSSLPPSS